MRRFLKTAFSVSLFILAQSIIADRRMTLQLKWDSGLEARNRLFLCQNDIVPHTEDKWERGGFDWHFKKKKRKGTKSPFLELDAQCSYWMRVKPCEFITE